MNGELLGCQPMNLATLTYDDLKTKERLCHEAIYMHTQLLATHEVQLRAIRERIEQVKKQEKKNQD